MGDVRELARECRALWLNTNSKEIALVRHWSSVVDALNQISAGVAAHGLGVGPIRHAVEVECERRGWGWEWFANPLEGHRFNASVWSTEYGSDTYYNVVGLSKLRGTNTLECALLALKWLLENPAE